LSKLFSIIYEKLHKIVSDFIQKRKKWSYLLSQVDYKSLKITRVVIKLLAQFLKCVLNNSVIKLRKVELSILRFFYAHLEADWGNCSKEIRKNYRGLPDLLISRVLALAESQKYFL
jgi:hypothetical protein